MLERQRIGIANAKVEGAYKGRAPVPIAKVKKITAKTGQGTNPPEIAKELSLGRSTV